MQIELEIDVQSIKQIELEIDVQKYKGKGELADADRNWQMRIGIGRCG